MVCIRFGCPMRRMGIVCEQWQKTPGTQHYSKALPENTEFEMVKCYGIFFKKSFIGIQRFVHKSDRIAEGFQFGPEPNVFDMIAGSDNPNGAPRDLSYSK